MLVKIIMKYFKISIKIILQKVIFLFYFINIKFICICFFLGDNEKKLSKLARDLIHKMLERDPN